MSGRRLQVIWCRGPIPKVPVPNGRKEGQARRLLPVLVTATNTLAGIGRKGGAGAEKPLCIVCDRRTLMDVREAYDRATVLA